MSSSNLSSSIEDVTSVRCQGELGLAYLGQDWLKNIHVRLDWKSAGGVKSVSHAKVVDSLLHEISRRVPGWIWNLKGCTSQAAC